MADLLWNDETIASDDDLRQKFTYGGLNEAQWQSKYGLVPSSFHQKVETILSTFKEDTTNTIDELTESLGTNALLQIKHGLNRVYDLLSWEDDSGWLAENTPAGREHLDWSDHKGKYQRYSYFWDNPNVWVVTTPAHFHNVFEHGGETFAKWRYFEYIPPEFGPQLNTILNTKVINDSGETVRLNSFLSGTFTQTQLNVVMAGIYDADDGAIAKAFTDTHGCYRFGDLSSDKRNEIMALGAGQDLPRHPPVMQFQDEAMALEAFRLKGISKEVLMSNYDITEDEFNSVLQSFYDFTVDGSTVREYIEDDDLTVYTTSMTFMYDALTAYTATDAYQQIMIQIKHVEPGVPDVGEEVTVTPEEDTDTFIPQTEAWALENFKPNNMSKAAFLTAHSLTEEAYTSVFNAFLNSSASGHTILEYINSDGTTFGTTSSTFMNDRAQNFINSVSLQDAIDHYNSLQVVPVDDDVEDVPDVGPIVGDVPIGAVNDPGNQDSDDAEDGNSDDATVGDAVNNTNVNGATKKSPKAKGLGVIVLLGGIAAAFMLAGDD